MPMPDIIGFLFPGQGSQYVGMGKDLYEKFPTAQNIFNQAESILGYSIAQTCFEGPEEKLTRTRYAQPAIFAMSVAALSVFKEKSAEISPSFVAGLSLGEFTALVAADSIRFEEALRLVQKRAEAMERAAKNNPGTMASILGLAQADCEAVAHEAGCYVANLNTPEQIVLSGTEDSVEKACSLAELRGAKRAIRLKVSGAFHSPLMREAREDLERALSQVTLKRPSCVFIPNAAAAKTNEPESIRKLLAKQLTSPVRWVETMARAEEEGVRYFLEVGPGKILKGLARKCNPAFQVEPCGCVDDIEKLCVTASS